MFHHFKKLVHFILFSAGAVFALCSCSITRNTWVTKSYIPVQLDAYSNRAYLPRKVAFLVCNDERIPNNDLRNQELEYYLKNALAPQGYSFTDNIEDASISIFYEYGISHPQVYTSERVVPVWGVTGIGSSVTATQTGRSAITGRPVTVSATYNAPMYGQIGERVETQSITFYLCWANISAYDVDHYRKTGEDKMLWLTEITSSSQNNNLREIFPYMMAAVKENIGQNRNERMHYNIPSNPVHADVLGVKGTLVAVRLSQDVSWKTVPQAIVAYDVYRNGELVIRAGTPVNMTQKNQIVINEPRIDLYNFSTFSIYGRTITLKGDYQFLGELRIGQYIAGGLLCVVMPIGLPMMLSARKRPVIHNGTVLYVEME